MDQEKRQLLLQLEEEEEMITNKLQRKLHKLEREKVEMEVSLEQEQESMVNRLQKQLDEVRGISPSGNLLACNQCLYLGHGWHRENSNWEL